MANNPIIFLSHITEEEEIASIFHSFIEEAFPNIIVFRSSDHGTSLPSGSNRIDRIIGGLRECSAMVVLCSQQSVNRPWINFESGAGWIREIPVTPVCHSNMDRKDLPLPLNLLTAANANVESDIRIMLRGIAEATGSRNPRLNLSEYIESIVSFEKKYSFTSIVDESFKILKSILVNKVGMSRVEMMNLDKISSIKQKLESINVCRVIVAGTIISPDGTYYGVKLEPLENFNRPEVQRHLG